jgi:hypothetical protein
VKKREAVFVLFFLAIGLALRLYPLIQSPSLIGADSFFHSSIIQKLTETGSFPTFDPFSWGGRPLNYSPGFHFFVSGVLLATGLGTDVLPFFGALFFCLTFLGVYTYSRRQGINPIASCGLFATVPVLIWKTTTNLLPDSLWIFLFFVCVFLASSLQRAIAVLAVLLFASPIVHPMAFLSSLFALVSSRRSRFRSFLICVTLVLSVSVFFYLGTEKPTNLYQDVPASLRPEIFEGVTSNPLKILDRSGPAIGLAILAFPANALPLILPLFPAAFGIIELDRALVITSLAAVLAGGVFLSRRRNFSKAWILAACVLWAVLKLSALSWAPLQAGTVSSLGWISENTPASATIASSVGDGYLVAYVANRRNVIDGHFVGRADSEERLLSVRRAAIDPAFSRQNLSAGYFLITERSAFEFTNVEGKTSGLPAPWMVRFFSPGEDGLAPSAVYSAPP